jgi:N-acyl homoserine lactone hydrolase
VIHLSPTANDNGWQYQPLHSLHKENNRGVPTFNTSKEQTLSSMQRVADILKKENATLWINHDKAQRDGQKLSPAFYD